MILRFDHVGVVVRDAASGRSMLRKAFGITRWTQEFHDPVNEVIVQFGLDAFGMCYETVAPLTDRSPVRRALEDGVNIVNHVAYLADDLKAEQRRLRAEGFVPAAEARPAIAYGGRNIQFFFSRQRFLFELIEAPGHQHEYAETPE